MSDSPANRRNNWPPENPSALSTANSWVRSRADMIMVLPSTSKMMPIMTNDMTFIAARQVDPDDTGIPRALERLELISPDQIVRINVEESVRVHRQPREELILIDINPGEPKSIGHLIDAGHLSNAVAIGERQRKHERHRMAGDQTIGRRGFDAGMPRRHDRAK